MNKHVCIHQPDFMPWLGFFHRLVHTDHFVVLDDVQFLRRGWHHRDKIKTREGAAQWIGASVSRNAYHAKICDMRLDDSENWRERILQLLQASYRNAPCYDQYIDSLAGLIRSEESNLVKYNWAIIKYFLELFEIEVDVSFSSQLNVTSNRTQRLIDILKAVNAATYISGTGAKAYLDVDLFDANHIALIWQKFDHPQYPQLHGPFVPFLSAVDALLNIGADQCRSLVRAPLG